MTDTRVRIKFERRFTADSPPGKVFDWLRDGYGSAATDQIVMAVKILFLPQTLAEAGESEETVKDAIKKSRRIFEEKMRAALEPYFKAEEDGISRNGNAHLLGAIPSIKVNPTKAPIYEPAPSSQEDDFELDESKLFEN